MTIFYGGMDMHSFNGKSCTMHHNEDFSGEVIICNKNDNTEVHVDTQDLIDFIAEYVRSKKLSLIENMSSDEILGVK